jgi:hypothetical protein
MQERPREKHESQRSSSVNVPTWPLKRRRRWHERRERSGQRGGKRRIGSPVPDTAHYRALRFADRLRLEFIEPRRNPTAALDQFNQTLA